MVRVLIGIDDTDNQTSPGTGQLARRLIRQCVQQGCLHAGVTRHQFLVDPRIPYTSHNSGACIAIDAPSGLGDVAFAPDFLAAQAADGSDPGICLALADAVGPEITDFGWRATREVVTMSEAFGAAAHARLDLRALGGTGLGVIGALASVGLRAGGSEGRFLDLPGLRDLARQVRLDDLSALGLGLRFEGPPPPGPCDRCDTLDWIRPRLERGRPVVVLEWSSNHDAWIPVDRQKSRPLE